MGVGKNNSHADIFVMALRLSNRRYMQMLLLQGGSGGRARDGAGARAESAEGRPLRVRGQGPGEL